MNIDSDISLMITTLVQRGLFRMEAGDPIAEQIRARVLACGGRIVRYESDRACYISNITDKQVDHVELHLARKSCDPFRAAKIVEDMLGVQIMDRVGPALPPMAKRLDAAGHWAKAREKGHNIIDTTARVLGDPDGLNDSNDEGRRGGGAGDPG